MHNMRDSKLFSRKLIRFAVLTLLITVCIGGELTESESFFNFIRAADPQNVMKIGLYGMFSHPCKWEGIKCDVQQASTIIEIRLENLNLSGRIDADSLCKLQNLQVLSLAKNHIRGSIPNSIASCTRLTYLNLSSNLLSGTTPVGLYKLENLKSWDISKNHLHYFRKLSNSIRVQDSEGPSKSVYNNYDHGKKPWYENWETSIPLFLGIVFMILFTCYLSKKTAKLARERKILKALQESPSRTPQIFLLEDVKPEKPGEKCSELVFFVDEHEKFKLEDLFEATADLQSQSMCSSLYKVTLKNNSVYAVKRLKKLQASFEEFGQTMRQIGNLKHQNILPLVCFNSTNEEKLLIYKYQSNGSLLNLLDSCIQGKREFPWKLRLSIVIGIARGLDFIFQRFDDQESIPHGNLKLSNILLDENEDPLISEYGLSKFLDPKNTSLFSSNGYIAPEKTLSEQGDVFSFGVILLELLTGKTVEKSGIDLPKWVKAMVREEWTGEVFDKEVSKAGKQWAFPLLNVSLKCVSNSPDDRPSMAEVLEKIEEVWNANVDHEHDHDHDHDQDGSSFSSLESCHQDSCLLHTIIPETWDTPGSNY